MTTFSRRFSNLNEGMCANEDNFSFFILVLSALSWWNSVQCLTMMTICAYMLLAFICHSSLWNAYCNNLFDLSSNQHILPLYSSLNSSICFLNQHLLGFYDFKSKTHQDACCPEGMCRAAVFALHVKEELTSWPEQSTRQRTWLTVPEAASQCRYQWMQEALLTGFSDWHDKWSRGGGGTNCDPA